jgi:hypothetical protein
MRLHHDPQLPTTTTGAGAAAKDSAGATRLVTDIRDASLGARLRASVKLAQQKEEKP